MKKALAIIGDSWHASAPLSNVIIKRLQSKYKVDTILTNMEVTFSLLSEYNLILLSRFGRDDVSYYSSPEGSSNDEFFWLTKEQEDMFYDYVKNGGNLFFQHGGFAYYRKGGGINKLAKAFFLEHPPREKFMIKPVEGFSVINDGIEPYEIIDEEYIIEMDGGQTNVFLEGYSEKNGRSLQGWFHPIGKGRVAVFVPGHDMSVLEHPMVGKCIENIIEYLSK